MSQPNVGGKKRRRQEDHFRRVFRIYPRSSRPIASPIASTSTNDRESQAARSTWECDSALQSHELIVGVAGPGPAGGLLDQSPHLVVDDGALPLSSPGTDTSPAAQVGALSDKSEEGSLWARALSSMSEKDKSTLSSLSGKDKGTSEGNETTSKLDVEELLAAVRAKREMCLENQWEFEFRGRAVNLRYQADKIITWLAKFKEVGDIAIQKDPGHAALPWAGIRFLLQVGPGDPLP